MKNKTIIYLVIVLIIGVLGGYVYAKPSLITKQPTRSNCLADDCLAVKDVTYPVGQLPANVKKALDLAIKDEYLARATYETVIVKYGNVRPFSMIIRAEEQHISSLKAIYDKYGITVPKDELTGNVVAPSSLQLSCQTGVKAEINNAELYRSKLLPEVKNYEDITIVFTNLMNASQNRHLPAFQRCS